MYPCLNYDHVREDAGRGQLDVAVRCMVKCEDDETFLLDRKMQKSLELPGCPAMRQRLYRHMRVCHGWRPRREDFGACFNDSPTPKSCLKESSPKSDTNRISKEVLTEFFGKSVALSPTISMDDKLLASAYNRPKVDKFNQIPARHKTIRSNHDIRADEQTRKEIGCNINNENKSMHKLKQCKTVVLHSKGLYKDNLKTLILHWLIDIPVFPCISQDSKVAKDDAVKELIEAIYELSDDVNDELYEADVKKYIHNFIERLPLWLVCSLEEQREYKDQLKNKLFEEIEKLNNETLNLNNNKKTYVRNKPHKNLCKIEELIINYLKTLEFVQTNELGNAINMQEVNRFVLDRLKPVIKMMSRMNNSKVYLKTELKNTLRDLPLASPHNNENNVDKYADELVDKIIALRNKTSAAYPNDNQIRNLGAIVISNRDCDNDFMKYETVQHIIKLINTVIDTNKNEKAEEEFVEILIDSYDSVQSGNESDARSAIFECLTINYNVTHHSASFMASVIVNNMKNPTRLLSDKSCSTICFDDKLTNNVVAYMSNLDLSDQSSPNYPLTSTPKKSIPKISAEERQYTDKLSKLIESWIDTIPELAHVKDNAIYKEAIVSDLAGNLTDEIKLEQYTPDKKYYGTRDNMITCAIRSWLIKFEERAFENIEDIKTYVEKFIKQFNEIPVPELTRPHHGSRKDIGAAKFRLDFSDENIKFQPDDLDKIEDGISIWINEQPSRLYVNDNRDDRNEKIHDFAMKIQSQIKNKRSSEIKLETKLWLDKMLKQNEKKNIESLSENLKERLLRIPLGQSFNEDKETKEKSTSEPEVEHAVANQITELEINKTLKEFIDKYIENNCEEDDSIVKEAFCEILKSEFRRYSPQAKHDLYAQSRGKTKGNFHQQLTRELYYIKEISDWLKMISIDESFNVVGNKKRIDFIINLARDICEIEIDRMQAPDAMDYEKYLVFLIHRNYVRTLPIWPNNSEYQTIVSSELLNRIVKSRDELDQPDRTLNDSLDVQEQNIDEFIDEYIRVNGKGISDDPVKLEAWNARIIREIKRMAQESELSSSFKAKVYNRLADVPIPGDDSVVQFNKKLLYAHEIGDWIKNLPLQPVSDQLTVIRMITDLADKLSEKQLININNDPELKDHITKWILALPLEKDKEVNTPVLIQQLSKRIDRVKEGKNQSLDESSYVRNNKSTPKATKNGLKQTSPKKIVPNMDAEKNKVGVSGELVVEAIEGWCNKLPIKEENKDDEKEIKDGIAIKLYQKVGELNLDPRFNDDILYKDQLNTEIDDILKNLQHHNELVKNENLKSNLIDSIVEARSVVKEQAAGDQYRHKLENTIEASIPYPVTYSKIYDPGFELYKNKLANMFLLENFDYCDDPVKLKYEVKIREEIDKYFSEAQKRNAVPLSRDQIYNELYSALYKVPIPNEKSVIQEVEEVKLRCEIDGWFEGLPIREAVNLNEQLEWDQILSMLTKRIYEIENNEPKAEDIIHKEVKKWLIKFPVPQKNIDKYAKDLVNRLKETREQRKCTPRSKTNKVSKKGKTLKKITKRESFNKNVSQEPGPSGANNNNTILHSPSRTKNNNTILHSPSRTKNNNTILYSPIRRTSHLTGTDSLLSTPMPAPCCVVASTPVKKPADIMLDMVEAWCQNLPLFPGPFENEQAIKDDLATKILRKLSDLNANPEIFDDDFLYDDYIDDELDRLMKNLPICCELQKNTEFKKYELVSALNSIKPLFRVERARHDYKKEIKNTVRNMLKEPLNTTPDKEMFEDLVDEIADSFIQLNYNKDDAEENQFYKKRVRDAVVKYYTELDDNDNDDTLVKQNKILCELAKIPVPNEEAIKEDVEEIKMKEEVSNFLDDAIPNTSADKKKLIKLNLSKRLHDLEKSGHSCAVDKSMKEEIVRSFKKANTNVDLEKIESFVNTLRNNEAVRKSPPVREPDASCNTASIQYRHSLPPQSHDQRNYPETVSRIPSAWHTLPTPKPGYRPTPEIFEGNLSDPRSIQSPRLRLLTPDRSIPIESNIPPARNIVDRFQPSNLTRRQTLDIPADQRSYPRRQSLQAPLRYDYNIHDNRNVPSYREVCSEQRRNESIPQNMTNSAVVRSPQISGYIEPSQTPFGLPYDPRTPTFPPPPPPSPRRPQTPLLHQTPVEPSMSFRPVQSYQGENVVESMSSPALLGLPPDSLRIPQIPTQDPTQTQVAHPYYQPSRMPANTTSPPPINAFIPQNTSLRSQTPVVQPTMSSRPVQSYQGFENAVDAMSSPAQLGLAPDIPISTVPQSTRNAASIRGDAAPTVSNIPLETPEDISPPGGTNRLLVAPQLLNPPRKRRRNSPNEERGEEYCECFLQNDRKRRCVPISEGWGGFPLFCYMPVPMSPLCYF